MIGLGSNYHRQSGDTIVEVLIAMAVMGLVLSASFAVANKSLSVGRSAQERTEALKITETQIELLRSASNNPDSVLFDPATSQLFCIDNASQEIVEFGPSVVVAPIQGNVDPIVYPVGCRIGPSSRYGVSVEKDGDIFSVRTRWERFGGGGIDESVLYYRTYKFEDNVNFN